MSEALAFIESMNQSFTQQVIYGDTSSNKDGILGLTPRYNSLSASANSSANIIDAGGTGSDNTSVWLVVWGAETIRNVDFWNSGIIPLQTIELRGEPNGPTVQSSKTRNPPAHRHDRTDRSQAWHHAAI